MGLFLSMSGVIGKNRQQVIESLQKYAVSAGGGLTQEALSMYHKNCCVIEEQFRNTTVFNPYAFMDWEESSRFLSEDLQAPVFSFHIHDGDFWMYTLYHHGEEIDQFNPIPDYFDGDISPAEIEAMKGKPALVAELVPNIKVEEIENYFLRWDLDAVSPPKAYPKDEYAQEDWQLLDFMATLHLPYPLDNDGNPRAGTFRLWTTGLPNSSACREKMNPPAVARKRPWWKFW